MTLAFKAPLAILAVSTLGLAACQAPLPGQTTENQDRGALIGAGLGALAGVASGDDRAERIERGLGGAIVGAGIGGAIGNQLDRQEAELRQQLGGNVDIVNNGNQLVVTLPQDILFATDSATLTGSLTNDLRTVAASLNRYPNTTVNVIGHTDNTGAAAYNQSLSERRAQAVASVLTQSGVAPSRIRAIGRGEDQPVATNLSAEGRQQNRRVEIIITPNA
ncbi:OmpA family protein [Wenxinia saemankumensis]|uniref:Outer membrane protein OmpA n=1 Tax=Wenxinia saemankumensis TaxID=1447782 RepID=A0A1M6E509_9RHOB|nr:OmpA family protein [Wenxinia saemankumensis]SHI80358.1 Outer membrane protein OmpA [Wenxinia saemankumensis]